MTDAQRKQLIAAAKDARRNAYAPYSGFHVGAALLTSTGEVFSGCNVENASYGLTICAERVAAANAVATGCQSFETMALIATGGPSPCGACLQFLAEFESKITLLLVNAEDDGCREVNLRELLPEAFYR